MKLRIKFLGREKHAIGINWEITETIEAENQDFKTLFMALYEKGYELHRPIEITELR